MTEKMKKFYEESSQNEELKEKLMNVDQSSSAEVIRIAGEYGYELTEEDLNQEENEELSLDELESVSGGGGVDINGDPCFCAICGGKAGSNGKDCGCGFLGFDVGIWCVGAGWVQYQ